MNTQIPRRIIKTHMSDKELINIFPESKYIIPAKIREWQHKKDELVNVVKPDLERADQCEDEFSKWFWNEWLKEKYGSELLEINKNIGRLKRLENIIKGRKSKNWISHDDIQVAESIPIDEVVSQYVDLKKLGKGLVGLCPFHEEKHPSFYVYKKTNSCWCFGCNQGGNTIMFLRLIHGYSFKEAIKYLLKL